MQYGNGIRKAAMAMAVVSAALAVTACRAGDTDTGAAGRPSKAPADSVSSAGTPSAPPSKAPAAGASGKPGAGATPTSKPTVAVAKACTPAALKATAYQAADRPEGTGTGAAVIEFTNVSGQPCILQGHPSVAGAGNGSPQHNAPLSVTRTGSASPVRMAPGGRAWVKLTFVQVQGEGDGYCTSGSKPVVYPTLVVGLPGSGAHQVALRDGRFAECDNKVTATPVSAAKPA